MKKESSIRIGVIGVGYLGNLHLKHICEIPQISISGIFDTNQNRSDEIGKKYNVNSFSNLHDLLKLSNAISIVTPTSSHFSIANQALEFGCHLFIEKPITNNLKQALLLLNKADKLKKIIQVGHIERFNPAFIFYKKSNLKPTFVEAHRLAPFNPRANDVPVILDLMIHDIDIILSLIDSTIKDIKASGVKVISDTIDIANVRLEFNNKCVANLTASRISQKKMRKMRFFQKENYVTLDFQKGSLEEYKVIDSEYSLSKTEKIIATGIKEKKYILYNKPKIAQYDALNKELCHFFHSIKNTIQPETDGYSATEALRVALEIQSIIDK